MAPLDPNLIPEVTRALAAGNKIEAIRLYREHTGLGLKESKDAVEALEKGTAIRRSALAPGEVPRSRGRGLLWLLIALGAAALYLLLGR